MATATSSTDGEHTENNGPPMMWLNEWTDKDKSTVRAGCTHDTVNELYIPISVEAVGITTEEPELYILGQKGSTKSKFGFGSTTRTHEMKYINMNIVDSTSSNNKKDLDSSGSPWMHVEDWHKWRSQNYYSGLSICTQTWPNRGRS